MHRIFAFVTLGLALQFNSPLSAGELSGAEHPLQVNIMEEPAQFTEPYHCAFITAGENKFTFIIPQGFRLKSDPASGRLVIGNSTGVGSISFAILSSDPDGSPITSEECRAAALRMHQDARIVQGFTPRVLGRSGQGVDLEWKVSDGLYECQRVAYVPTPFGVFMFTATSGRKGFPEIRDGLDVVLATFRSSTDGKFHPAHIDTTN
jgi:hypothetical protein